MKTIRTITMTALLLSTGLFLLQPLTSSANTLPTVKAVKEEDPDTCGIKCVTCGGSCEVNCCDPVVS